MLISDVVTTDAATDATLITTGMLPVVMLASAALTAPISLLLLWWYRRAVLRAMSGQTGMAPATAFQAGLPSNGMGKLELRLIDATSPGAAPNPPAYHRALASLICATTVYVVAGLAYALVLTCEWLVFTSDDGVVRAIASNSHQAKQLLTIIVAG